MRARNGAARSVRSLGALVLGPLLAILGVGGLPGAASADVGPLKIEIVDPPDQQVYSATRQSVQLQGVATLPGAIERLDLMLVIDTSRSLKNHDPYGRRIKGAMLLVDTLPERGDVRIGLVGFSREAELLVPLTADRKTLADGLRDMGRGGFTEIDEGLGLALDDLARDGRRDATQAVLVLSDGRSDPRRVHSVAQRAKRQGVAVHTLLLGADEAGIRMMEDAAVLTGGSFQRVEDVKRLPEQLLAFRTSGIERVTISVNGSEPRPVPLESDRFDLPLDLVVGENRIVATATTLDGTTRSDAITLRLSPPGCGRLEIGATAGGLPAASTGGRTAMVILDASGSMWGRTEGRIKMTVAKQTLREVLDALPAGVDVGLRAYGHRQPRELHDCRDTELLVKPGAGDRAGIFTALGGLAPRGQTPIAYALRKAADDLRSVPGERAVVLVTDGIESCGGDGVAAARALQAESGISVHVIGFGLDGSEAAGLERLRAIAAASKGRFFTPANASELAAALSSTVGTPWVVLRDGRPVARGALGRPGGALSLPSGKYEVRLEGRPAVTVPIEIDGGTRHQLSFELREGRLEHSARTGTIEPFSCDLPDPD